jgi:hypothetical protein
MDMDGDLDYSDHQARDEEHDEFEYSCPECDVSLDYDFFESDDDEEDEEDEENEGDGEDHSSTVDVRIIEIACQACGKVHKELDNSELPAFCMKCGAELNC